MIAFGGHDALSSYPGDALLSLSALDTQDDRLKTQAERRLEVFPSDRSCRNLEWLAYAPEQINRAAGAGLR